MGNRGQPGEGVDPTAATLHLPQSSRTIADRKKPKEYSAPKKNPKPVEAGRGGEIGAQEFIRRYEAGKRLGEAHRVGPVGAVRHDLSSDGKSELVFSVKPSKPASWSSSSPDRRIRSSAWWLRS